MAGASEEALAVPPEEAAAAPPPPTSPPPPPPLLPPPQPEAEQQGDGNRTFPLDVTSAGADLLRGTVQTKLSEFMGSYTDEVLAEYVVVLVGHGKQQKQATADLEAFLGVQSEAFVSWLWEHLTENLHVYTKAGEKKAGNDAQQMVTPEVKDNEKTENPTQENAKEENHLTKREPQALRQELKRSRSPEGWARRRRSRAEDKPSAIERVSPPPPPPPPPAPAAPRLKASRRLLEFAVRDAVAPVGGSRRVADANTKRLRSIVSGSADHENAGDSNGKMKSRPAITKPAKNSPAMMIALKAAAAAAEDVNNRKASKPVSRFAASIWDRLGHKSDEDDQPDHDLDDADEITEKMEYVHVDSAPRNSKSDRHTRKGRTTDRLRAPVDTAIPAVAQTATASHYGHDHGEQFERRIEEVPESLNKKEPSKRHTLRKERRQKKSEEPLQYKRVLHTADDTKHKDMLHLERRTSVEQEKLVDIPNGKSQDLQDVTEMKRRMRQVELEVTKLRTKQDEAAKVSSAPHPPAPTTNIPSVPAATMSMHTAPSTSLKPPQSSEDPDSRIILVTNVHFATTKEAISTHFGSCGEVVKVTMLTDGVSGKPKGSAYVEFSSKDAADRALSLNESCLLSRPIRVARKDANVAAETSSPAATAAAAAAAVMRPRPVRMPMRAFPRAAFMRGSPYMMRPPPRLVRPPYPVVAPHLQWKRDGGASQMGPSSAAKNGFRSSVGPIRQKRSLSYVRPVVPVTPTPPEAAPAAAVPAAAAAAGTAAALSTSTEDQKGS